MAIFGVIVVWFEVLGVVVMVIGFVLAAVFSLRSLLQRRGGNLSFVLLRTMIGSSILLGLEIFVAADVIHTIAYAPSLESASVLGLIVLIRTVLSISLQIEIEGVLPWRRALLKSGGAMLSESIIDEVRRGRSSGQNPSPDSGSVTP